MGQLESQGPTKQPNDKFRLYLSSLCMGYPSEPSRNSKNQKKLGRRETNKRKRMTFLLDRALLKLSRKNLIIQQFSSIDNVGPRIEDHLATRITSLSLVQFHGSFSDKLIKAVPFGMSILPTNRTNFDHATEAILTSPTPSFKLRNNTIEAMVFNQTKNSLKLIQHTLKEYGKTVDHFVFVIEREVEAIDYHNLFVIYKDHFMFEVQKIMLMNTCAANIIYISRSGHFLKFDNQALVSFFLEELSILDPGIDKVSLSHFLLKLFEAQLYVETSSVVGELMASDKSSKHYDQQLITLMTRKHPACQHIIAQSAYGQKSRMQESISSSLPKFHDNTPQFFVQAQKLETLQLQDSIKSQQDQNLLNISFDMKTKSQLDQNLL